jgi:ZIP family zinc transporter
MDNAIPATPPVAFAITLACGAATWVGAAVVFIPVLVKRTSPRFLAAALSFSAGVLLYVSMIDIFGEGVEEFESAGISSSRAYIYTTLCYFGGMIAIKVKFHFRLVKVRLIFIS